MNSQKTCSDKELELDILNQRFRNASAPEILTWVWDEFGHSAALSSSFQTDSLVLLHLVSVYCPKMEVLFVDTGFHFPETLQFLNNVEKRWSLNVTVVSPAMSKKRLRKMYGPDIYYENPDLCCRLNKVEPLRNALRGKQAWISGIRKDQTSIRKHARLFEKDGYRSDLFRIHPLINWDQEDIDYYREKYDLPPHPLYEKGYVSVGCFPCTTPVKEDSDTRREGRWRGNDKTECGLHINYRKPRDFSREQGRRARTVGVFNKGLVTKKEQKMVEAKIGNKVIGDGHPSFLSFEPGATHTGIESAKHFCEAVAQAGGDAVKFQTVRADDLMQPDNDSVVEYMTPGGKRKEKIYDALKRRELTYEEWADVKSLCDDLGLLFISSPSSEETVDWLKELNAAAIKVSKSDISHRMLIEYIAQQGIPVILDGRERIQDVEAAARICEKHGISDIVIMHCPSGYPAEHAGVHLSAIPYLRQIFGYPVGYADHSSGTSMNFAAVGLGVDFIEKTITEDRSTDGVEHYMSLEINEISDFVQQMRAVEAAFGNPRVIFNSRVNVENRRSILAKSDICKGETIKLEHITFKRPGNHIPAEKYDEVVGRQANQDISAGTFLEFDIIK